MRDLIFCYISDSCFLPLHICGAGCTACCSCRYSRSRAQTDIADPPPWRGRLRDPDVACAERELNMLSAIFVDRPRLAIVIAIVTTIAGTLALFAIPMAQYPDIVPPQVSVTTLYPGANSSVVDAAVAQPIEAQVVGVDKMIYMKSVSGDDGSYSLVASFELGTNPDINTVNVNNRVQTALSSLPPEVQRQGIVVKKKSSALLAAIAFYSPKHTHDPLFLSNYVNDKPP